MSDLKAAIDYVRRVMRGDPVDALNGTIALSTVIAAAEREHNREIHIGTHGPGCWALGWRHYACAQDRIAELEALVKLHEQRDAPTLDEAGE